MMLSKLAKERIELNYFEISCDMYIRKNGDFICRALGDDGSILKEYTSGNINLLSNIEIYNIIVNMLSKSLNYRNEKKAELDIVHKYEIEDYKVNKCDDVKYLYFHINKVFPDHLDIVDAVLLRRYEWGGGKYVHLLPLNSIPEQVGQKIRDIFEFKQGHLPGTSEEEQKKYRIIPDLN